MSMDGASHPCSSFRLGSYGPSPVRKLCSPPLFWIGAQNVAFQQAYSLPCKHRVCMHSHYVSDLHTASLHLGINPHVRICGLSVRLQNDFLIPSSGNKHKPCAQKLKMGDSHQEQGCLDLVSEILEFMENSDRPELFPSRPELTRAGRSDLVEAILARGGWMAAGWDMEPIIEEQVQKLDNSSIEHIGNATEEEYTKVLNESLGECQNRQPASLRSNVLYLDVAERSTDSSRETSGLITASHETSQSARAVSMLDRQKGWEKVADLFGLSKPERGEIPLVLATQEIQRKPPNVNGILQSAAQVQDVPDGSSRYKALQLLAGGSQHLEMTLRAPEGKKKMRRKSPRNGSARLTLNQAFDSTNEKVYRREGWHTKSRTSCSESDKRQQDEKSIPVSHRIHGLEAELVSTLDILKSARHALADDIKLKQKHRGLTELEEVSDILEFCETEIMNKKRELRTARAQRTAFEGKLALDLMEFKKSLEEKDKQLEQSMQVLQMLRTARIVWPNPAFEVFLAGSYDGWTSWRRMEKSSAGVFVTALQLYPGQYEIKFIVNGEWRVDPNRPILYANGFENNVLTIV